MRFSMWYVKGLLHDLAPLHCQSVHSGKASWRIQSQRDRGPDLCVPSVDECVQFEVPAAIIPITPKLEALVKANVRATKFSNLSSLSL